MKLVAYILIGSLLFLGVDRFLETVDLSERETPDGRYKRSISKTYNPDLFGIQPSEFII